MRIDAMTNCEVVRPSALAECIAEHMGADRHLLSNRWTKGASARALPDLQILEIPNGANVHYVTAGASTILDQPGYGTEFCFISKHRSSDFVELLAMVAYLHSLPEHRLGVGHTVSIGKPIEDGSLLDRLLVSVPYVHGSGFEYLHKSNGSHIRLLWLLPISAGEERYRHEEGLEALETLFDEVELDAADFARPEVV